MNKLHEINREQKSLGADFMQGLINNGQAWHMEGSIGRQCMDALRSGMCMLPKKAFNDAYGNRIPSRDDLKQGEMGTYVNTLNYYNL